VKYHGSVMVFPQMATLWNVRKFEDITMESLALLDLLYPKITYLIIGCGEVWKTLPTELNEALFKKGIVTETMSTYHAAGTFNFCASEGRPAALILLLDPTEVQVQPSPPVEKRHADIGDEETPDFPTNPSSTSTKKT